MNSLSIRDLCCLFCCPPLPSRIAAKLGKNEKMNSNQNLHLYLIAFLPPEATYSLLIADNPTNDQTVSSPSKNSPVDSSASLRYKIFFSDKAEWQHSSNEMTKLEPYFVTTSRHNQIACIYVKCTSNPKYYILFSHGNAVDLGKPLSLFFFRNNIFCIQVKCLVFLLFWVHVYNVIYLVMIIPVMVLHVEKQVKRICMQILKPHIIQLNNDIIFRNQKLFSMDKVLVSELNYHLRISFIIN